MRCVVSRGLFNQYVAGVAACLSIVATSSSFGWITPILDHLLSADSEIPMTLEQSSWIISMIEVGPLLTTLPAGMLMNHIGRKPVLLSTGPICIISWLMIIFHPSALILGISRFFQGLSMGVTLTAGPVYLGEIASDTNRGALTSLCFNSWWAGLLISYVAGPSLSFNNFNYFILAVNIPFLLLFFWQPESPHYCLIAGKEKKAFESLKWFRDTSTECINLEIERIKLDITEKSKSTNVMDIIATEVDRKAFTLLMVLSTLRICSGTGSILVYATEIFDLTPNLNLPPDTVTIALGIVALVGGCVSSFTIDTLGRRPLLMISCIGSIICHFITGTYYFLLFNTSLDISNFSWIAPVFILVYIGLCTAGLFPVCSTYVSEMFPPRTRGIASSLATIMATFWLFVMLLSFQTITDRLGLYVNFYIYSIFTLFGSIYVYFLAPETKGKSFAEIRKELSNIKNISS